MQPRSNPISRVRRRGLGWPAWLGFAIAVAGWAVLILDMLISNGALQPGNLVSILSLRSDVLTIAQTAIMSGFALALFGVLHSGFGALTTFFDAVLQRSSEPRPRQDQSVTPTDRPPMPVMPTLHPQSREPVPPGRSHDRNYVIRPDGSVEVETMFGTRLFATMDEARDFIR